MDDHPNQDKVEVALERVAKPKDPYRWFTPSAIIAYAVFGFMLWLAVSGLFSIFAWNLSHTADDRHHYYALSEYFHEAGFDLSAEHPVRIGGNLEGTGGYVSGSVGLFGGSIGGEFSTTSSVRLLLPLEDGSDIIAFFPSSIFFLHEEGVENASVRFTFDDVAEYGSSTDDWHYAPGDNFLKFSQPVRTVNDDIRDSSQWTQFTQIPLQDQLTAAVERIDLYVTPEQLSLILNT